MPKWAKLLLFVLAAVVLLQTVLIIKYFASDKPVAKQVPVIHEKMTSVPTPPKTPGLTPSPLTGRSADWFSGSRAWDEDPFFNDAMGSLGRLYQHMYRMFDHFAENAMVGAYMPSIDMEETEKEYIVHADLPGLEKEKIDITVSGTLLTIRGIRETGSESADDKTGYYSQERSYGSFSRSLTLPGPVDETRVNAAYQNGVLTITLPKAETNQTSSKVPVA